MQGYCKLTSVHILSEDSAAISHLRELHLINIDQLGVTNTMQHGEDPKYIELSQSINKLLRKRVTYYHLFSALLT